MLAADVRLQITLIGDAGADAASMQEKQNILRAFEEAGLAGCVHLLGYQLHEVLMREAYAHHVFLHPSVTAQDGDTEGGAPVTIIEMLATGMPVVSTTHCDIPEVMGEAAGHLLAPERDVQALTHAIRNLLESHRGWDVLTAKCRERVESEYDARMQASRLAGHYNRLCGPSKHA